MRVAELIEYLESNFGPEAEIRRGGWDYRWDEPYDQPLEGSDIEIDEFSGAVVIR